MATAKMSRGLVMLTFTVVAIVLCSHRLATAEEVQLADVNKGANSTTSPWTLFVPSATDNCLKIYNCARYATTSCITECCALFPFSTMPIRNCICWRLAEHVNKEAFTALQKYCGFKNPCPHKQVSFPPSLLEMKQLEEVVETSKAMDNKSSCNQQLQEQPTCCAKDKEKIKNCMLNTASIDQCCPTFSIMLGRNCDCYNYAKDLDNQALITLESYCDVTNPCRSAQVM
ncbi:uncharacterized protein LOC107761733 isoform X2 [Nicotiana tabacum]|uniref:Uncharacterized protein LOC107761733 isoform X2 n=1 Tax=Nicotiana tabacum TaxID=4097 RepID=A0AC58RL83_TOBAC